MRSKAPTYCKRCGTTLRPYTGSPEYDIDTGTIKLKSVPLYCPREEFHPWWFPGWFGTWWPGD